VDGPTVNVQPADVHVLADPAIAAVNAVFDWKSYLSENFGWTGNADPDTRGNADDRDRPSGSGEKADV
jgi:hypothetical protein